LKLRRGWDYPVPNGESLKQVYDREIPYYESTILPQLKEGKNIIIAGSGNNLRALVKYLEDISDDDISDVQIAPGEIYLYDINNLGEVTSKEIRNHHELKV
jgi:2,3-bisphosphoglycerate-dependent phosphoglycerate mutase